MPFVVGIKIIDTLETVIPKETHESTFPREHISSLTNMADNGTPLAQTAGDKFNLIKNNLQASSPMSKSQQLANQNNRRC